MMNTLSSASVRTAAMLVAGLAAVSQGLGLVRDRILSHTFGAGESLDIYYAAFQVPDFLFAAGTSLFAAAALVPVFARKANEEEISVALGNILSVFSFGMIIAGVALFFAMPLTVSFLFDGFSSREQAETVALSRIMLLSPFLLGISNIVGSAVQARGRFVLFGLAPIAYNLSIIGGALFLYPIMGLSGLAWGVVAGALLHAFVQSAFIFFRSPYTIRVPIVPAMSHIVPVVLASFPRTLSLIFQQGAFIVLISVASGMAAGSVTVFTFAFNVQAAFLTLIGVSFATASFPAFAALFSPDTMDEFRRRIGSAVRAAILLSFPAAALLIVARESLVHLIFNSGAFTNEAAFITSWILAAFAISLPAQCVFLLLARGYYAAGRTARPFAVNAFAMAGVAGAGYVVSVLYSFNSPASEVAAYGMGTSGGVSSFAVVMLAIVYSLGFIANAVVLSRWCVRDLGISGTALWKATYQGACAFIVAGIVSWGVLQGILIFFPQETAWSAFVSLCAAGVSGVAVAFSVYMIFRVPEIREVYMYVRRIYKAAQVFLSRHLST